ncbi:MAG TPA: HEAT repeat domain-containing protein [Verrucomicrobiae bacterium]
MAGHGASAPTLGNAPTTRTRPVVAASEPMQKTLAGWLLDLESPNAEVVQAARKALADLGPDAAPAIPQLAQMLKEGRNCNSAAYTLANIGTNALPVLIDALTNGNPKARLDVAGAIGTPRFGEAGEAAVPALVECLRDEDPYVRKNAIAALQAIPKRPDLAVPALIAALADPDASINDNADITLRKYAKVEADATIPMLVEAAQQSQNPVSVRFRAAEIVRAIAPERAKAEGL